MGHLRRQAINLTLQAGKHLQGGADPEAKMS